MTLHKTVLNELNAKNLKKLSSSLSRTDMPSINQLIADELNARNEQVAAAVKLLD